MDLEYNVKHNFNIKGLSEGDSFLGCPTCWFRYDPNTVGVLTCPKCNSEPMMIFTITKDDLNLL